MAKKRLNRLIDTGKDEEINRESVKTHVPEIQRRIKALEKLREASSLMRGLRSYHERLGVSIRDIGIIADFIEYDIKAITMAWPHEPEDLRDPWPHARHEVIRITSNSTASTTYCVFNYQEQNCTLM